MPCSSENSRSCKPLALCLTSSCSFWSWVRLAHSSMSSIRPPQRPWKKPAFPSNRRYGIPPRETFAVKSMEVNFNLLKLKLDMVYRDLPIEEAQKRFNDATVVPEGVAVAAAPIEDKILKSKAKPKRKVVKALVPKNM